MIGIIAGTGLYQLSGAQVVARHDALATPWGAPSGEALHCRLDGKDVVFLPRHGQGHATPPHAVNYRANVDALRQLGVTRLVAVAAVGSIDPELPGGALSCPLQLIDYTWGRASTFFDGTDAVPGAEARVEHIDFTSPYDSSLRDDVLAAAARAGVALKDGGVYAVTQGPRLETAAEIDRLERDGATLVGMTGMPEAALAREAGMAYAHLAVVANAAAGRGPETITMDDIRAALEVGMRRAEAVLRAFVAAA